MANKQTVTQDEYGILCQAWMLLGQLGGNTAESPFRAAWLEMREVVQGGAGLKVEPVTP